MSSRDLSEDGFLYEDDLQDEYADSDGIGDDLPDDMAASQKEKVRARHGKSHVGGHRKQIRVRPMSPEQMQRYPDTKSVIITKMDGRQLCLVRKD